MSRISQITLAAALCLFYAPLWANDWHLNMTEGVTEVSHNVYSLHMLIFWVCCAIGLIVFGVMLVSMILHRKSQGAKASNFHESTTLEIIWTVIPFIILVAMAFPATKTLINIYDTEDADIEILITGYRWKWKYEYIDEGISYFSSLSTPREQIRNKANKSQHYLLEVDKPLIIPADKKVRFLVTSADVIHSWWVPALAVKRDAIPGYINEAWSKANKLGTYRGQCAELCGKDHGFMPIEVKVVSEKDYRAFIKQKQNQAKEIEIAAQQTLSFDELYTEGEKLYLQHCATCHQADGKGTGIFPSIAGSAIATGPIAKHLNQVINGGRVMPAFGEQLSPVEIAKVITYQRNAFGNNMGELVQPIDIVNYKQGQ